MLTIQEHTARLIESALEGLFITARHIPEDKFAWTPMGDARTTQSQLAECAAAPILHLALIQGNDNAYIASNYQKFQEELSILSQAPLDTIYEAAKTYHMDLLNAIRVFPNEQLETPRILPFNGGMNVTNADILFLPYWNLVYHTGQINYIQTMLGDKAMHF